MCRLLSQVKEATQMHRLSAFLLVLCAVVAVVAMAVLPQSVTWG
jgi:hypothetical protein